MVEVALVVQWLSATKRIEGGPDGEHVFPHARSGRIEGAAVPPLDMGSYLGTQSEPEAAAAGLGQLPRHLGRDHGASGEGHRDPGQDVELGAEGRRST